MYIRIDNQKDFNMVQKFLEDNSIEHKESDYITRLLFDEEATHRLEMYVENNGIELTDDELEEFISKHHSKLAKAFFDSEFIIDNDILDNITRDVVEGI